MNIDYELQDNKSTKMNLSFIIIFSNIKSKLVYLYSFNFGMQNAKSRIKSISSLKLLDVIGMGASSIVYLASDANSYKKFAVKRVFQFSKLG